MGISVVIPLVEHNLLNEKLVKEINLAALSGVIKELVLVKADHAILPLEVANMDRKLSVHVVTSPSKFGNLGAIKRGLFAATEELIITIEHQGVSIEEILRKHLGYEKEHAFVLGLNAQQPKSKMYDFLKEKILDKNLRDDACAFRIISKKLVGQIVSRIYLERDGFNTEWAYVARKLNLVPEIVLMDGGSDSSRPNFKKYWNLVRIRFWHFPLINISQEHMPDHDIAQMFNNESHHWWFVTKAAFMKQVLKCFIPMTKQMTLDAGCGTGHNVRFLAECGNYVGIDVSIEALKFCQKNDHTCLAQANLEQLPFKDNCFDLIISLDVIEHTKNPWRVIREFKRVLNENGSILVAVPAYRFLFSVHDESLCHMRRYDAKDLRSLLEEAGFEIKYLSYFYCLTFLPVAMIRIFRKLFEKNSHPSTDMFYMPMPGLNAFMKRVMTLEVKLFGHISLPFGTSVMAVAVKKRK